MSMVSIAWRVGVNAWPLLLRVVIGVLLLCTPLLIDNLEERNESRRGPTKPEVQPFWWAVLPSLFRRTRTEQVARASSFHGGKPLTVGAANVSQSDTYKTTAECFMKHTYPSYLSVVHWRMRGSPVPSLHKSVCVLLTGLLMFTITAHRSETQFASSHTQCKQPEVPELLRPGCCENMHVWSSSSCNSSRKGDATHPACSQRSRFGWAFF